MRAILLMWVAGWLEVAGQMQTTGPVEVARPADVTPRRKRLPTFAARAD